MLINALIVRLLADNLVTEVIEQAPVPTQEVSCTITGETNLNPILNDVVSCIQHRNCNFHICVGNNMLPTTSQNAQDFFNCIGAAIAQIMRMCLGANDMASQALLNQYLNQYGIAEKYHAFTFENIHFLFMDTASGPDAYSQSSPQYPFIVQDLQSANADPTVDWIIVIMNRCMYGTQTNTTTKYILKSLRDIYHPLFEQYGVHIVINGYLNNYQRQHCLQFNPANTDSPNVILSGQLPQYLIDLGKASFDDGAGKTGCLFINAGMGGASHDNVITPANSYTASYNSADFGYLLLKLKNNLKSYTIPGDDTSPLLEQYHELTLSFYETLKEDLKDQIKIKKVIYHS